MLASEKQKMLSGDWYQASDPELLAGRARARALLRAYNALDAGEVEKRASVLAGLFGEVGENAVLMPVFACDYGYNIRAGRNLFANWNCIFLDCASIVIGDDAQIGPAVQIYTAIHPIDPERRRAGFEAAKPVAIGNNVWIGGGAILLPGVTVGDNTVIGAGSVVARDLPSGVVAVGNPCRVVREIQP